MSLWAIIPVKPLSLAKSRLSDVLSPDSRAQFAEMMLRRMLKILKDVPEIAGTVVISRDTKALAIARDLGAKTVKEGTLSDLNPALTRATEVVRSMWHGTAVLVLPADLPFVTGEDISEIAEMGKYGKTVILATDYNKDGTNAMLVRPPGLIPYTYGKESFELHAINAKLAGADLKVYESDTIALDVDIPSDLEQFNQRLNDKHFEFLVPFLPDLTM